MMQGDPLLPEEGGVLGEPGLDGLVVEELGEGSQPALQQLEGEVHHRVQDPRPVGPDRVGYMSAIYRPLATV
jgi:hypothetical protein